MASINSFSHDAVGAELNPEESGALVAVLVMFSTVLGSYFGG